MTESLHAADTQSHERDALRLIADAINAKLGDIEAQEWLVESICRVLDVEASLLLLVYDDRSEVVYKNIHEKKLVHDYQVHLDWQNGLIERCLQNKKSIVDNTAPQLMRHGVWRRIPEFQIASFLSVPLIVGGQSLGALVGLNKRPGEFTSNDQELLERIATSVAHAIHNMRLIQQLKVANADLEVSHWQLLRSRNTLRALFDSIPTSIYIIDQKYMLAAINLHRANRIGSPPNQLVGKRCYEALFGRDEVCPDCRVIETIFDDRNTVRTRRFWETDQEPQEWEISTYPIYDDSEQVVQAILLEQDVTEKRRLEATLAQSEKLAAVGQLAAGLAHEINNPLTAIIANAQLLNREIPVEDDKQELVDLILRAGNRASQVVRNLLDLARKEQYDLAPVDVNETIRRSLTFVQHEFTKRNINLIYEPTPELPKVMASQDHLQGVWLNLITNALDALDGEPGELRIITRQQGNEVRVMVSDSGKGMPPERLTRIFEPFYTTKAPGRGTGLGLSVVHRVIKQHGGRILVDSQLEVGTRFTVILPMA
jgi:two-component system NtrC family sensor kinase